MKLSALQDLEKVIVEEVVRRRKLGGYSQDADGILLIGEVVMRLVQHIIDEAAPPAPLYGDIFPDDPPPTKHRQGEKRKSSK